MHTYLVSEVTEYKVGMRIVASGVRFTHVLWLLRLNMLRFKILKHFGMCVHLLSVTHALTNNRPLTANKCG